MSANFLPPYLPPPPPPPPPPPAPPPPVRPWLAPASRRVAAVSPAEPGRWTEPSEAIGGGLADTPVATVADHREGDGRQSQDEGGGGDAAEDPLDPRIRHIGDAVAMVCRFEQVQVVWSARIPLDPELLPETVLFMAYSPGCLDLRFETVRWEVRELLGLQLPVLRSLVAARLVDTCSVNISC